MQAAMVAPTTADGSYEGAMNIVTLTRRRACSAAQVLRKDGSSQEKRLGCKVSDRARCGDSVVRKRWRSCRRMWGRRR